MIREEITAGAAALTGDGVDGAAAVPATVDEAVAVPAPVDEAVAVPAAGTASRASALTRVAALTRFLIVVTSCPSSVAHPALREMIVDEPGGLHEGVHRRRSDEDEPATLQLLRERHGLSSLGGHVGERPRRRAQVGIRGEPPDQLRQRDV